MELTDLAKQIIIGAIVTGIAGFFLVWFMMKVNDRRSSYAGVKYLLKRIYNELTENQGILACDKKNKFEVFHKLSHAVWSADAASPEGVEDPAILRGLVLLYREIERFNALCDKGEAERLVDLPIISAIEELRGENNKIPRELLNKIISMKAVLFAVLVRTNQAKPDEWQEEGIDWKKVKNPFTA
ncbi:MAG: hypothetical protein WCG78_01585 [Candidatus Omnitrophota bacterium]